jgi:phosphoglycerate dehydrogenase-like enzyme
VLYATGHDHVDTALLARRGVGLAVLPDYATVAVAEHTVALMLALSTRLHLANDRCRGRAPADVSLRGVELAGRTLGIVGLGRIGRHVARLGAGLGMRVLGADPDPAAADAAAADGIATTGLGALLTAADVVAVCASHRYGAPPVLGAGELAAMRPGSWLVNAARSALVDTDAVTGALRRRHLRGYAVDDHLPGADPDLVREGRLLQTGHSAWWRDEVLRRGARMWGDRLVAAARGVPMDVVTWPGAADREECVAAG